MSLSDRVVLMNGGVIEQEGAPTDLYGAPRTSFAADFIGSANLLPAKRSGGTAYVHGTDVAVAIADVSPDASVDGEEGKVMLRQEDLHLRAVVDEHAPVLVEIVTSVYRGADVVYVVELAGRRLRVVAPRHELPLPSGPAGLGWRDGAALWLAA